MKLNTKIFSALAAIAALATAPAQAITISNLNGVNNFTGFDWDSNGTAFTTGFTPVANSNFTLTYFSTATSVKNGALNLNLPGLDDTANGIKEAGRLYEYTIVATLNEQVASCTGGGTSCTFNVLSGTFNVYYDLASNANALAGSLGTGFGDGTLLISGTFGAQAGGTFTVSGANGIGVTTLGGSVLTTNLTYINPALSTTTVTTTLQLGGSQTNGYVSPGGFNGSAFLPGSIVFQADANQSFEAVPEPGSLALVAAALLAGGLAARRNGKKSS